MTLRALQNARQELESLRIKCIEQAAVIESLRDLLTRRHYFFYEKEHADKCAALDSEISAAIDGIHPTDSKQVLQEWLDKVLGKAVAKYSDTTSIGWTEYGVNADIPDGAKLYMKPEIKP